MSYRNLSGMSANQLHRYALNKQYNVRKALTDQQDDTQLSLFKLGMLRRECCASEVSDARELLGQVLGCERRSSTTPGTPWLDLAVNPRASGLHSVHDSLGQLALVGVKSASAGAAAGMAAWGAASTFGVASTGTAISTLSGAAATNATLALFGGGSIAAGGGGMVVGATVLGGIVAVPAILVGLALLSSNGSSNYTAALEQAMNMEAFEREVRQVLPILQHIEDASNTVAECIRKFRQYVANSLRRAERILGAGGSRSRDQNGVASSILTELSQDLSVFIHLLDIPILSGDKEINPFALRIASGAGDYMYRHDLSASERGARFREYINAMPAPRPPRQAVDPRPEPGPKATLVLRDAAYMDEKMVAKIVGIMLDIAYTDASKIVKNTPHKLGTGSLEKARQYKKMLEAHGASVHLERVS